MKGIIILIIVAAAGYFTYDHFFAARMSSAYKTYASFADYLDNNEFANAINLTNGSAGAEAAVEVRHEWKITNDNLYIKESFRKIDDSELEGDYASFSVSQKSFTKPSTTAPTEPDYLISQEIDLEKNEDDEWVITRFVETIESLGN